MRSDECIAESIAKFTPLHAASPYRQRHKHGAITIQILKNSGNP